MIRWIPAYLNLPMFSVDMDDFLGQFPRLDPRVREAFALLGDPADVDCLLRTELDTAQASDAVRAEAGLSSQKLDVVAGTYLFTGTAADAAVVCDKLSDTPGVGLAEALAHQFKHCLPGRSLLTVFSGEHSRGDLGSFFVDPFLCRFGCRRRVCQLAWHAPDRCGTSGRCCR